MGRWKQAAAQTNQVHEIPSSPPILEPKPNNPDKTHPKLIIFDVDGVLVDVRGSFHSTTLETVRFFTGKRVTRAQLQGWKNRSGYNDDWKLSTAWVQSLGGKHEYDEVKRKFVELYWGENGTRERRTREVAPAQSRSLRRMSKKAELAIFTGRTRQELDYTLDRCKSRAFFQQHRYRGRCDASQTRPRRPHRDPGRPQIRTPRFMLATMWTTLWRPKPRGSPLSAYSLAEAKSASTARCPAPENWCQSPS